MSSGTLQTPRRTRPAAPLRRLTAPITGGLAVLALASILSGCAYIWTYDQAFPPEPLDFPRWDPPDSLAFRLPDPPPVEAVIMDADLYYLMHPEGEQEYLRRQQRATEVRRRRAAERAEALPDTSGPAVSDSLLLAGPIDSLGVSDSLALADSLTATVIIDSMAMHDSLAVDSAAVAAPLPPVQIDLTPREEDTLIRRANVDIEMAESILRVLEGEASEADRSWEKLEPIRNFIRQSRAALKRRDFQGAANLALKARSLAEDLNQGQP